MSVTKHVFMNCDKCGVSTEDYGVGRYTTLKQIRKATREEGWARVGGKDLCPKCKAKAGP